MSSVLVIHDRSEICQELCPVIELAGHDCISLPTFADAWSTLGTECFDIVIIDIDTASNADVNVDTLARSNCRPDVLAISSGQNQDTLERVIRAGAWDILFTPFTDEELIRSVNRCAFHRHAKRAALRNEPIKRSAILGTSPRLERCLESLGTAASTGASVLILGETGTGKELFARAVHENSSRANNNFIVVDCTNLPRTLAESLLFGHERGAFTGAAESHEGLFKQANGGTIFLDEIGDLDLDVQKSLLRVLQERKFRPLSSKKEVVSDFRLVAATNRDLGEMVSNGSFRGELYHRLSMRVIQLPPLRERKEDIPLISGHHLREICTDLGCPEKEISRELHVSLLEYDWPGNIRELINVLHATVHNGIAESRLYPQHLPVDIRARVLRKRGDQPPRAGYLVRSFRHPADARDPRPLPSAVNSANPVAFVHSEARKRMSSATAPRLQAGLLGYSTAGERSPTIPSETCQKIDEDILPLRMVREIAMHQVEEAYLRHLVSASRGDFHLAQTLSGLSRARLYGLLSKHAMDIKGSSS
jgi:DNA-binding NtrC family response regulator